jgi:hypothetical protein
MSVVFGHSPRAPVDWYPACVADVPFENDDVADVEYRAEVFSAGTDHEVPLSARVKLILVWFRTTYDECSYR